MSEQSDNLRGLIPPNNDEAERMVLGAMLQDQNILLKAVELLTGEDFYQPNHTVIFNSMVELNKEHRAVDVVTVDDKLSQHGQLSLIGGSSYLMSLITGMMSPANGGAYIDIVREKSTLRRLIKASEGIVRECYSQANPLQETLNHAEKNIFDIVMQRSGSDSLRPMSDVLLGTYEHIEELSRNKGKVSGVPTGFHDLDDLLTGLHPGELILIGARPSMGKTSFAMNIASYAGHIAGKKVAVFSLEMPCEQIALRMLCSVAKVDMQRVRQGTLSSDDWVKLCSTISPLAKAPIYVDDTAGLSPTQLRSRCRRLMMDHGLDLVIIDYLGLMHTDGRPENRQLEVSEISRSLKAIALELKVPVIACAQLSRASTTRENKRPILSDLRDSGSIEQDADVVMFLHREAYYNPDTADKNIGEVIISKQRNGPLGTVKLAWLSEYTTYANLSNSTKNDQPF